MAIKLTGRILRQTYGTDHNMTNQWDRGAGEMGGGGNKKSKKRGGGGVERNSDKKKVKKRLV